MLDAPASAKGRPIPRPGLKGPWWNGAYSLRSHLIAFGLAVLLPVSSLAGVLLARAAMLERAQLEARLLQVADDLADDIDHEIDQDIIVLQTLATLPSLQNQD